MEALKLNKKSSLLINKERTKQRKALTIKTKKKWNYKKQLITNKSLEEFKK